MPKIKSVNELEVGDVFYTSFINNQGKQIIKHPFLVIQKGKDVQIIDARAILGAFALTDIHSMKGKELAKTIDEALYSNAVIAPSEFKNKKTSIAQVDAYYLFGQDILPLHVSKMFSQEKTKELVKVFAMLAAEEKIVINRENLPVHIFDIDAKEKLDKSKGR